MQIAKCKMKDEKRKRQNEQRNFYFCTLHFAICNDAVSSSHFFEALGQDGNDFS
jgi:hypothetical protein